MFVSYISISFSSSILIIYFCLIHLPLQTAHTDDIIHGITPNTNGAKYMLIIKHHFNRPDKQGVVRLSKDLVAEAVANRHV